MLGIFFAVICRACVLKTQVLPRRRGNGNWREAILEGEERTIIIFLLHPPTRIPHQSERRRRLQSNAPDGGTRRDGFAWLWSEPPLSALCLLSENGEGDLRFPQQVEERFGRVSGKNAAGKGTGRCRRASLSCRTIFVKIGGKES